MLSRIATCAIAIIVLGSHTGSAQKPVKEEAVWVSGPGAPASLSAMKAGADTVVFARYTGKQRLKESTGRPEPVTTNYAFEVIEALKYHHAVPGPGVAIEVETPGGVVEYPTYTLFVRVR